MLTMRYITKVGNIVSRNSFRVLNNDQTLIVDRLNGREVSVKVVIQKSL